MQEKLEERYGVPFEVAHPSPASTSVTEKASLLTDKLLRKKSKFELEKA